MSKAALFSNVPLMKILVGVNALFALAYIALIAVVMSYAASHVEYAEQARSDEAVVAKLEATYFAALASLTATNYHAAGYEKPRTKTFVEGRPSTALSTR